MQQEDRKTKVKKGWLAVRVGLDGGDGDVDGVKKFTIPITYLYHPLFNNLLDKAQELYGYHAAGPLSLPCSVDDFLHLRWRIERESPSSHQYHSFSGGGSLSFKSC